MLDVHHITWLLLLFVTTASAEALRLTCSHQEEFIISMWGKTAPALVEWTAIFNTDDFQSPELKYEYSLTKFEPQADKICNSCQEYIDYVTVGPTYVQDMQVSESSIILKNAVFKTGLAAFDTFMTYVVSRKDLSYSANYSYASYEGSCTMKKVEIKKLF